MSGSAENYGAAERMPPVSGDHLGELFLPAAFHRLGKGRGEVVAEVSALSVGKGVEILCRHETATPQPEVGAALS